jgi:hypothetical protein
MLTQSLRWLARHQSGRRVLGVVAVLAVATGIAFGAAKAPSASAQTYYMPSYYSYYSPYYYGSYYNPYYSSYYYPNYYSSYYYPSSYYYYNPYYYYGSWYYGYPYYP